MRYRKPPLLRRYRAHAARRSDPQRPLQQRRRRLGRQLAWGEVMTTTADWKPVAERLPDDDTLVLIALNDDDVWTGFRDGEIWRYVDSMPIAAERVTHWAHMPAHPAPSENVE